MITPLTLCAAIALGLAFLARVVEAISDRLSEMLGHPRVDTTKH